MLDFSTIIDLPLIWAGIISFAIIFYVLLDGFDLGVGILFPFAPSDQCRNTMINSIAPFWDGNETWLVLGGGGLFAAFPLAYSILLPAFYIPIIIMLLGLIMRGVAFEFRFKTEVTHLFIWDYVFHYSSIIAAFCQGMILGGFVQGVTVNNKNFAGGPFDFITSFSLMTGIALLFGYSLLGSCWLIMKTADVTQKWARKVAIYSLIMVGVFMALVSLCVPFFNLEIKDFWFSLPNFYYLFPIPLFTIFLGLLLGRDLTRSKREYRPFIIAVTIFLMGYVGLGLSIYPYIVPFQYTYKEAASCGPSLSLLLIGVLPLLPLILCYTAYSYYVFRGKATHESLY